MQTALCAVIIALFLILTEYAGLRKEKGKKMAKYIDRAQLIDWLKTEIKFKDLSDGLGICLVIMKEDFERAIKHMPDSIIKDVAPVKHGRWKQTTEPLCWDDIDCVECSECKESWIIDEDFGIDEISQFWHYCPKCGAKMDGESDE